MSLLSSPTVCLDGTTIRRIREEKKLTQLYVAKVVGVTTDTISRWENNRYPTIKRENALRLAEALEVPVEHILQDVSSPNAVSQDVSAGGARTLTQWGGLILLLVLVLGGGLIYSRLNPKRPAIVRFGADRNLPPFAAPGNIVPVRVHLAIEGETKGFILREHFPPGWKLIEANPPASSIDNEAGTARWMVKPGETRTLIVYLVRVAEKAPFGGVGMFKGEIIGSADGRNESAFIGGINTVAVAPHLWADLNGDNRIDDGEILDASDTVDEMVGVHLDWKQLETIWDAGSYRWDGGHRLFTPVKPAHPL